MAFDDRSTRKQIEHDNNRDESESFIEDRTQKCCFNCRYWEAFTNHQGECHRYPPSCSTVDTIKFVVERLDGIIRIGSQNSFTDLINNDPRRWDHPETRPYDWCGEFEMADWVRDEILKNMENTK